MIPSQMLKGTLEGSILAVISQRETYGYEISQTLKEHGFGDISEGTVYPLLLRLEKNGLITATYHDTGRGPKRKYYSLTPAGQAELEQFAVNFQALEKAVHHLLGCFGKDRFPHE